MEKQSLLFRLKSIKLVRVLAFPPINAIRGFRLFAYQFTKEAGKVRRLKGSHTGERCFIIGNGPSLKAEDLSKLKGEYCFAANRIYKIFPETDWRPQSYLCVDSYVLNDIAKDVEKLKVPYIFIQMEGKKKRLKNSQSQIIYINNYCPYLVDRYKRLKVKFSRDVSHHFVAGGTVVYTAIQLAAYMGFREIYLLGVDHNYSKKMDAKGNLIVDPSIQDYFGSLKPNDYSIQNIETSTNAYKTARRYCEKHGILIKNLTNGGKLEVFRRGELDTVLKCQKGKG